jgi:zinc transport system substrate-binding protein
MRVQIRAARCVLFCLIGVAALFLLSGCQKEGERKAGPAKLKVVATLFPLYDFAREMSGGRAEVLLLLPPGVEPHSFEPKPGDILRLEASDLFIYTGKYMEPWAERVVQTLDRTRVLVVDASAGVALDGRAHTPGRAEKDVKGHVHKGPADVDPHIWLDFADAQVMVDTVLAGFVIKDPTNKETYERNARRYKARLAELDERYRRSFETCKKRVLVHGGHFAFNYLARRYGLQYLAAYSGSPDAEPTAKRLIEMKEFLIKQNVHYIFYEELITPRVAEVIAKETGAQLLKLNGAHNVTKEELTKGTTFLDLMEENLRNLKKGLECT